MIGKYVDLKKIGGLAVICMTALSLSAFGQKSATVKGEILDMSCYLASGAHGPSHKSCAQMCVKQGSPMGLLTSSGKVYLLISDHDKPEAYAAAKKLAGDQAVISGTVADRSGFDGLVVDDVKSGGK